MAVRTIANGGGNWSATGTWVEGVVPTSADDVVNTATSGALTIDVPAVCRSIDLSAKSTQTVTHSTFTNTLTIGDGTPGPGNVALKFMSAGSYVRGGTIIFASTSSTVQTVDFGGKTLVLVQFNGAGGKWQLTSAMTTETANASAGCALLTGTLDTNGQACSWRSFSGTGALTRTLTMGSSAITITGTGTVWTTQVSTGLTITANTATITMSGAGAQLSIGGVVQDYNGASLVFSGSGIAGIINSTGTVTFANVTRTGTAVKTDSFITTPNLVVTGTFTVTGNSTVNRVLVQSTTLGTTRTITAAAVALTDADFTDITGAGAAAPWTGTRLGDATGNSGITFTTSATQTFVGGTKNWSDPTAWTSRVPLPQDDVIVNTTTAGTLTADMPRLGRNIDFTGFTRTLTRSLATTHYGSLTLSGSMTTAGNFSLIFAGRGTTTITTNGHQPISSTLIVNCPGGTINFADDYTASGPGTGTVQVQCNAGTINTNNHNITAFGFQFFGGALTTFNAGTSTLTAYGTGTIWNYSSGTLNVSAATIVVSDTSATAKTFTTGGSASYGTLQHTAAGSGGLTITGNANTFVNLVLTCTTARTITLPSGNPGVTVTGTLTLQGAAGQLLSIVSVTPGARAKINKTSGTVIADYVSLTDSQAQGGANFYANHATNGGNNTGWIFGQALVLGQVVATNTAQPITARKSRTLGQVVATNATQPLTARKSYTLGQATETDTPAPLGARKARTLGQATETDTPAPLTARKALTLRLVEELDEAFAITQRASTGRLEATGASRTTGEHTGSHRGDEWLASARGGTIDAV